jgi:bifunctional non-homologous end joining protein LigD
MTTANPSAGPGWLHEIKYDGFRILARREGERVRLFTRNAYDWTERYPLVAEAIGALKARSLRIDGEITVCDRNGLAVFDLLRHGPRIKHDAILFAFDLLELDGRDLRGEPIECRKATLARLLRGAPTALHLVDHLEIDGAVFYEHACKIGAEGMVSKRTGSRYLAGRTGQWRKVKNPGAPAATRELEEEWGRRK